ncbi:uncharacterized protein LOC127011499 [Drosophila biarmipes]|uniref:uncharacterized protein LOC127011499 n=1 Tax=Drosophila biarmipes TaxID=125945 RepID=UPI0021CC737F|nr:uncharacterized protein LOC127011499 [Drosophila biarmipes]
MSTTSSTPSTCIPHALTHTHTHSRITRLRFRRLPPPVLPQSQSGCRLPGKPTSLLAKPQAGAEAETGNGAKAGVRGPQAAPAPAAAFSEHKTNKSPVAGEEKMGVKSSGGGKNGRADPQPVAHPADRLLRLLMCHANVSVDVALDVMQAAGCRTRDSGLRTRAAGCRMLLMLPLHSE